MRRSDSGFSLVELALVLTLFGVVGLKTFMVLRDVTRASRRDSSALVLEDQARLVLDRIAYAIMGANEQGLTPNLTLLPLYSTGLTYQVSLGVEDGEVVWSDPERIALEGDGTQVVWARNPAELDERRVVWTNLVRSLLEGEEINGVDDNGNGLIDEEGLTFIVDGSRITISMSLSRPGEEGELATQTVSTTVTCRNRTSS